MVSAVRPRASGDAGGDRDPADDAAAIARALVAIDRDRSATPAYGGSRDFSFIEPSWPAPAPTLPAVHTDVATISTIRFKLALKSCIDDLAAPRVWRHLIEVADARDTLVVAIRRPACAARHVRPLPRNRRMRAARLNGCRSVAHRRSLADGAAIITSVPLDRQRMAAPASLRPWKIHTAVSRRWITLGYIWRRRAIFRTSAVHPGSAILTS
jgi:hypothetical protein